MFPGNGQACYQKLDSYATPPDTWNLIAHLLPRGAVVWEAAYLENSPGPDGLAAHGLDVIFAPIDFLTQLPKRPFDFIVTNPPFSAKSAWFERALALGKPFIFLMPANLMGVRFFVDRFADDPKMQMLIPRRRLSFLLFRDGEIVPRADWKVCPFDTAFFCYGFDLPFKMDYCPNVAVQVEYGFKRH